MFPLQGAALGVGVSQAGLVQGVTLGVMTQAGVGSCLQGRLEPRDLYPTWERSPV